MQGFEAATASKVKPDKMEIPNSFLDSMLEKIPDRRIDTEIGLNNVTNGFLKAEDQFKSLSGMDKTVFGGAMYKRLKRAVKEASYWNGHESTRELERMLFEFSRFKNIENEDFSRRMIN